ncbi:MAG: response regulator, partial [Spirochaetia bacterium]
MGRVLLVDDEDTTLILVKKILNGKGYEVADYKSPVQALMEYEPGSFDLILSDFYMPEMEGDTFLKKLRQKDSDTAFMFLTSNTNIQNAITMMKFGADDYINKPVIPEDLVFRVEKNIREAENRKVVETAKREKELLELENRKLVNWRLLYATKDIRQTEQMISLLSRTINQS